jgi:hypothetical protein
VASLTLPETLLFLGFAAEKGTTRDGLALSYALAGAQLQELALAGRIAIDPEHVTVVDATPTGDPQLDELLAKIASASDRPRKPGHWVMKRKSTAVATYSRRLTGVRALTRRRTRVLGIIPRTVFPVINVAAREELLAEVKAALSSPAPPPRDAALIALLHVTGLARKLVDDPGQRDRAKQIASDDIVATAVKRAIDAVHAGAGSGAIAAGGS